MSKDKVRMSEIQENLVQHIQKELKDDEDFMYMATMLLKHSMVLYKTFLEDEQIKQMLEHVGTTLSDDLHDIKNFYVDPKDPPTIH